MKEGVTKHHKVTQLLSGGVWSLEGKTGEKCDFTTLKKSEADGSGECSTPHYFRECSYFLSALGCSLF